MIQKKIIWRFSFICLLFFAVPFCGIGQEVDTLQMETDSLVVVPVKEKKVYKGIASYYHDKFHGRKMSNGQLYDKMKMTAASNVLPLNKWFRVLNPRNGKSVLVKITDRMHPKNKRLIDLSYIAAKELDMLSRGIIHVEITESDAAGKL